jgi:hypothetical protein
VLTVRVDQASSPRFQSAAKRLEVVASSVDGSSMSARSPVSDKQSRLALAACHVQRNRQAFTPVRVLHERHRYHCSTFAQGCTALDFASINVRFCRQVRAHIRDLLRATRSSGLIMLGAGPRAGWSAHNPARVSCTARELLHRAGHRLQPLLLSFARERPEEHAFARRIGHSCAHPL